MPKKGNQTLVLGLNFKFIKYSVIIFINYFQVDDELFKIVNEALLGLINNELKKCTVEQIVNQECHF